MIPSWKEDLEDSCRWIMDDSASVSWALRAPFPEHTSPEDVAHCWGELVLLS